MPSRDNATRCVLLAPAGDVSDVREQLVNQGWIAHTAHDPLPALAELCLLQRLDASRPGWGRTPGEALALVVVEPSRWNQLPEMLSAARRYVPSAEIWAYEDGTLKPLPNAVTPETYQIPAPERETTERPAIEQPAISGDEIAMLLDMNSHEPVEPDKPDEPGPDPDS